MIDEYSIMDHKSSFDEPSNIIKIPNQETNGEQSVVQESLDTLQNRNDDSANKLLCVDKVEMIPHESKTKIIKTSETNTSLAITDHQRSKLTTINAQSVLISADPSGA